MKTPAAVVLREFSAAGLSGRAIARELGINPSTVVRWDKPAPGGCAGVIPARYHRSLLAMAKRHGARLVSDDLVYGRR